MANLKAWFIEEIRLENGEIGQRQTVMQFDEATGDWIRPDSRLFNANAITTWNAVVAKLSDLNGKDRSWIINPITLMDYCNNEAHARLRRKRGTTDQILPNS